MPKKWLEIIYLVDSLGIGVHSGDILAEKAERLVATLFVLDLQDLRE